MNKADLRSFLERLRSERSPLTVDQRRKHLAGIALALKGNRIDGENKDWLEIANLLVDDPDWNVRQDVAELLLFVPEDVFGSLIQKLRSDSNSYVRHTVERTCLRRQRASREAKRVLRGREMQDRAVANFTKKHGESFVREAFRLLARENEDNNAEVAHDHLNLLANLKESIRVLRMAAPRNHEKAQDAGRDADDAIELLERSLQDFLAYSAKLELKNRPESLPFVVRRAKRQAMGALRERGVDTKGVTIDQKGIPDLHVNMTLGLVVQAMANIIINAVEANAKTVRFKATRRPGWIDIAIKDNGDGISAKKLAAARRFKPGRKNHKKTRSTGFGLCSVKKNIEVHGGSVKLDSVRNEGTTVTLSLPL